MEKQNDNIVAYLDGLKKIVEIEENISPFYRDVKALILERMKQLEDICTEKGLQIDSNLIIDENFRISNIEMNKKGNIIFEYNSYWAYGGCESGSFSLTYDEVIYGNFDTRINQMLNEKQKNDVSERDRKLEEYHRKKKELEEIEKELDL